MKFIISFIFAVIVVSFLVLAYFVLVACNMDITDDDHWGGNGKF